jgi:flavin-dependent dehydrogenase
MDQAEILIVGAGPAGSALDLRGRRELVTAGLEALGGDGDES